MVPRTRAPVWLSESIGGSGLNQIAMTVHRQREAPTAGPSHSVWLSDSGKRIDPEPNLTFVAIADGRGTGGAW